MLKQEHGQFLLNMARKTIEESLKGGKPRKPEKYPSELDMKCGAFCTLTKNGELRGCIGLPYPAMSLIKTIMAAAYSSAFEDPRFPKLEENEFKDIKIEISVLTEPKLIKVEKPDEYPSNIKIGEDGLIIEYGPYSGLLLPQVATEQKWNSIKFLENICLKAGLTPNMWKQRDVKLYKFQAQIFRE